MRATKKLRAPFRVSIVDEPRYGRYYFLEAFSIVRTLYLSDGRVLPNTRAIAPDPPIAHVTKKTFRWDYRIVTALPIWYSI